MDTKLVHLNSSWYVGTRANYIPFSCKTSFGTKRKKKKIFLKDWPASLADITARMLSAVVFLLRVCVASMEFP